MSKPPKAPGLFAILVHFVLFFVTLSWWLLPLALYYISMAVYRKQPSWAITLLHALLTTMSIGTYLIPLAIHWTIQSNKKK